MVGSWWSRRPAARLALLFVAGIILSGLVGGDRHVLLSMLCLNAVGVLLSHVRSRADGPPARVLYHTLVILLGWYSAKERADRLESDVINPQQVGEYLVVEGRIASEPVRKGTRSEMVVSTERLVRRGGIHSESRRVLVQVTKNARWANSDSLQTGDAVRLSGTLEELPGARNPGEFDYGRYLVLNGIQGFLVVRESNSIELLRRSEGFNMWALIGESQNTIYGVFDRYHSSEESGYLKGVLFGYRADLSAEIKESFMNTGTIHILAVSGSNVVVVALIFSSIIGFLRLSRNVALLLTFAGLLWYMVITGLSPSVIRATIMGSAILGGTFIGRKGDVYNSLGVAALGMLLWDPMYIYDVGFQLSFAAVLSIVYYYPRLEPLMNKVPNALMRIGFVKSGLQLFFVSLAAQIGTLPFTAFYFDRVSLVGVVANLVVVPVSGVNVLLGFATLAFSFVSNWMAACYAALDNLIVSWLLKFVLWCSHVPFAYMETLSVGGTFAVFYYIVVTMIFGLSSPRVLVRSLASLLLFTNLVVYSGIRGHSNPVLRVTVIDVGQGDAILVELPNARSFLIDSGPKVMKNDAGERVIGPLLKRKGIARLDALMLTHPHDDHTGGCKYLLEHFSIGQLILPDSVTKSRPYQEILIRAHALGVPCVLERMGESLQFDPTTRIFVLHAAPGVRPRDLNDESIVLKIVYGNSSMILMGDASTRVEDKLLGCDASILTSDIIKVAHHGAVTSSGEGFLRAVSPLTALISVGKENKFRHPSPAIISRYEANGVTIHRTDRSGALIMNSDGSRFEREEWRSRHVLSMF